MSLNLVEIFDSPWLISMLAKSGKTPQARLLSLFDILDDWLSAPHLHNTTLFETTRHAALIAYCTEQAQALGAENPDMLAEHIVLIARSAAQQTLDLQAAGKPKGNHLTHAKKAASALIQAQTLTPKFAANLKVSKPALYSIAASLLIITGAAALWLPALIQHQELLLNAKSDTVTVAKELHTTADQKSLTAHDATQMYAKYEQMRQGTCQFPEALQIPDQHKAIYLDNVVGGKLPVNLDDLAIANAYLEKVRCNFTPMLMAASK